MVLIIDLLPQVACEFEHFQRLSYGYYCREEAGEGEHNGDGDVFSQVMNQYTLFLSAMLSEIHNSLKLALPYLSKRCLKYYLGREQSFDKGFRVQFSIFSEVLRIGKFQPSIAYKSVVYKIKSV